MGMKILSSKLLLSMSLLGAMGLALSACTSSGDGGSKDFSLKKPVYTKDDKFIDPNEYCPKAVLRGGTENYRAFPRGQKGNLARMQLQATIVKVARECVYEGDKLQLKVGVAGRYVPGPKASGSQASLPIRIVVRRGDQTLYSKLHSTSASLGAGETYGKFQFIDDAIYIEKPTAQNIQIFVGFDEGPSKK